MLRWEEGGAAGREDHRVGSRKGFIGKGGIGTWPIGPPKSVCVLQIQLFSASLISECKNHRQIAGILDTCCLNPSQLLFKANSFLDVIQDLGLFASSNEVAR